MWTWRLYSKAEQQLGLIGRKDGSRRNVYLGWGLKESVKQRNGGKHSEQREVQVQRHWARNKVDLCEEQSLEHRKFKRQVQMRDGSQAVWTTVDRDKQFGFYYSYNKRYQRVEAGEDAIPFIFRSGCSDQCGDSSLYQGQEKKPEARSRLLQCLLICLLCGIPCYEPFWRYFSFFHIVGFFLKGLCPEPSRLES